MKQYTTIIKAIDPTDGVLKEWEGPRILADSEEAANGKIGELGMGYCVVDGELIEEINEKCKGYLDMITKELTA